MAARCKLVAASLFAIVFFCAFGALAANPDVVYRASFNPHNPLMGSVRMHLQNDTINPIFVSATDLNNSQWPLSFSTVHHDVIVNPVNFEVSQLTLTFSTRSHNQNINRTEIYNGDSIIAGDWTEPELLTTGVLVDITDSLSRRVVGVADTHIVAFTTTTTPVDDSGAVWILFPTGFILSNVDSVIYRDDDPSNDGAEPVIENIGLNEHSVVFQFAASGQQALPGSRISLKFWQVDNDTVAQDRTIIVMTTDRNGEINNDPVESAPFTLLPGPLAEIRVMPDTSIILQAGALVNFTATGWDQYRNPLPNQVYAFGVTVDSCGEIADGAFRAHKLGTCYVTASSSGITDSSGLITVIPGRLDRFEASGFPAGRIAGQRFSQPVVVTAVDHEGNRKYDYLGFLWFTSGDSIDDLPYIITNPYHFAVIDSGRKSFDGSGFALKRAGVRFITARNDSVLVTSGQILITPAQISHFNIWADTVQTAGTSFFVSIDSAFDAYGNSSSGEIVISAATGGGSSPDSVQPTYNNIILTSGSGRALQTLTNTVITTLRGTLLNIDSVNTTTLPIRVRPAALGRFTIAGTPDYIVAGDTIQQPIHIAVFDILGNLKTDYDGWIYFESSDPQALLPYDQSSQFHFLGQFNGVYNFIDEIFSLRTSGLQTIEITNGILFANSSAIHVSPAAISEFTLSAPQAAVAGTPFLAHVTGAHDIWGNRANGTVIISDSLNAEPSPNGTQPIFSPITVVSDSGSALQTLFAARTGVVLKGVANSVVRATAPIDVAPDALGSFNFGVSSPQVTGIAFRDTAAVQAVDRYGNIKTDYDASLDSVVIASSAGGRMSNNVLRLQGDFVQGRADLISKGITYYGTGGLMTFQATSSSGVSGLSNQVDMNAIRCLSLNIDQANIIRGDTATGTIAVNNVAGRDVSITDLSVIDGVSWLPDPSSDPALPYTLGAGLTRIFNITLPIPDTLSLGMHHLTAAATGAFGQDDVADTLAGFPDSISVLQRAILIYLPNTLYPETLSTGLGYAFSLRLRNTGQSALALYDSSYITFTDGTRIFRANLSAPAYIAPGDTAGVLLTMVSTLVPADFTPGGYSPTFHYFGNENGNFRSGIVNITDPILIQRSSILSYVTGSLGIDSLVGGQLASFSIQVQNNGEADFLVRHQNTRLYFRDSQREYIAYSDTASGMRVDTLHAGQRVFHFAPTELPANFEIGRYLPTVIFDGNQNGHDTTISFSTGSDSVNVLSRAQLRIDSTYAMSRNAPFVNTSQPCSLKVILENSGEETADSFFVHLVSTGGSQFPDSIYIPSIDRYQSRIVVFPVAAGSAPDNNEIFTSSLSGGIGGMSGHPVQIAAPLDNNALLITEIPAELALSSINIIGPPGALDSSVSISQIVTISVTVSNLGQADIAGSRLLTFYSDSNWGVDSLQREYQIGQPVVWRITAPDQPIDSAGLSIRISGNPVDENDGTGAIGPDSLSTIWFSIEDRASIDHDAAIIDPAGALDGTVSTDQILIIRDILMPHGIYTRKAAQLTLPDGFTTQDSLVKYPSGDTVSWRLRAPSDAAVDTAMVSCWIYDPNYNDSSEAAAVSIPLTVVNAALLQLSSSIIGPPSALDGIIEPGGSLQLEATVRNLGQAGVGPGQVRLRSNRTDLVTAQDSIRDFTPGVPIVWDISMPSMEIPLPIPIWVTIDAIPTDENTGFPASTSIDSVGFSILVRELYPRLILSNVAGYSGSAVKGQELSYITFEIQNRDLGGNFNIGISGFSLNLQSDPPEAASRIFSSVSLVSGDLTIPADNLDGSTLTFSPDTIRLEPSGMMDFSLNLALNSNVDIRYFTISFGDDLARAAVLENNVAVEQLNVISPRGEPVSWQSDPTMVLEPSFTASISSYPNPFSPQEGGTRIGYYLPAASDLEIKVFTLLGELVWSKNISSGEPFGAAGLHTGSTALVWNGANDTGRKIRSGVYICMVKNLTTGEEAKFKIAVVK